MIDHEKYSAPVARVYQDANDKILQALARRFSVNGNIPTRPEAFESAMLAQVNAVKREAAAIVQSETAKNADVVDEAIRTSMLDTLEAEEQELERAADEGLVEPPDTTPEESIEERASSMSATTKALLVAVGLSMVSSAADTYRKGVQAAMGAMRGAETIYQARPTTPVPAEAYDYRAACKAAVRSMVDSGVTGFVDRAGRHWSPEAYTSMVIKTTIGNAATQAVLDRNAEYGNSLISVRTNATARPGCAPWQGTVIDFSDEGGTVTDGHGGSVYAYPVSVTSYGQPAGIFGINCNHTPPIPFIAGSSVVHYAGSVDPEESAANYELTQRQRRLERAVRQAKREAAMHAAAGNTDAAIEARQTVRRRQAAVRDLVRANPGVLVRDYGREWTYGYND